MKSGTLDNAASLLLNGAVVSGAGTLQNNPGGTLSGGGVIAAAFSNQGSLELGSGLSLSVGNDASRALYVGLVVLDGGLGPLADISSAANIYCDGHAAGNAWLKGRTYAFGSGGGALVAAVPEP